MNPADAPACLDDYELLAELGSDGPATVHRARHHSLWQTTPQFESSISAVGAPFANLRRSPRPEQFRGILLPAFVRRAEA